MDIKHWIMLLIILILGYWLGTKFPGYLTKFSGGVISG